ncbi:MAG: oligosaccharide flippase family protein [Hyphomonadaceae bacterium]|nr:oligosaccharide flippase family protein [Hyphomonadaceae bacterium]
MALKRLAFGAAALSAARIFQLGASFLTVPFLARLLDPSDFGLVALAMAVVSISLAASDAGLSRSLIRTSELDSDAWSSAYWLILAATGAVSLALAALAWPASIFFETPALLPVMIALAIIPLMTGLLELPLAALIKREDLLPIASADFVAAAAGAAAAIGFALAGFGAWALVAQNLVNVAIRAPIILIAARYKPRFVFSLNALGEHLRFARDTFGYSVMQAIGKQIDPFVIGKALGTAQLGLYSVAFRIMNLPASVVATPVQTALYPRLSQLRDKPDELRALVIAATMAQAALVFPAVGAAAAASGAFFETLLSERWAAAGAIFSALAIAGMVQTISNFNSSLLQALGRTGERLRLTTEFTVLWAITAILTAQFGIIVLAAAFSALNLLYLPRSLGVLLKRMQCAPLDYAKALLWPVAAAAGIVVVHLMLTRVVLDHPDNWQQLGLITIETLVAYALLLFFGRHTINEHLMRVRSLMKPSSSGADQPATG